MIFTVHVDFRTNMASTVTFVERGKEDVKIIDKDIKNKWSWTWTDRVLCAGTSDEHLAGDCFRKLKKPGEAYCVWCSIPIKYGSSGFIALAKHAASSQQSSGKYKCVSHINRLRERRTNYKLRVPGKSDNDTLLL